MSMEPSSWVVPCDPGWSMEEAAAAWSSDHRISSQTSLPSHSDSGMQLQVVEYACPATTTPYTSSETIQVLEEAVAEIHAQYLGIMEHKMHKFPPSLVDVDQRYTVPVTVAIGPFHHGRPGTLEAEKLKVVALNQCISVSTGTLQDMYNEVSSVSPYVHYLYYPDELGIFCHHDGFLPMVFLDACFLVQFMRWYYVPEYEMDPALSTYFYANFERISTDIMMLENQIPWVVVQTIFDFMRPVAFSPSPCPCPWEEFVVAMRRGLKNQMDSNDAQCIKVDATYKPPHLLGLVRFYIVGKYKDDKSDEHPPPEDEEHPAPEEKEHPPREDEEHPPPEDEEHPPPEDEEKPMSLSISVAELADVGVTLVPKTGTEAVLADMRLRSSNWGCFSDLFVPPLCLTEANATSLVNMAALELCITPDFTCVGAEDSAVCSYLHLFAMLLDQERHVQDLRKNKVIEGGGLTSKETLEFFTSIGKNMRLGTSYVEIIIAIEEFKRKRSFLLKAYLFLKKNRNKILAVLTALGAAAGILSAILSLKTKQPNT